MENTVIKNLLRNMALCLATGGMLAACGGGDSQGPTASDTKLMADGEPCNAAWVSSTAYGGGGKVSRSGRNYTANWWTQGNDPVTSSGPAGSGQPWLPGYLCGGTTTTTKASTTTTKASTTTTKASTTTTKASTTTTKASTTTTKATTTTTNVSSCPAYVAGTAYASGKTVTNAGGYYTCDVGGWCSSGASAYEPGVGWAWTSAWHSASASACGGTTTTTKATTTTTKASTTTSSTGTTTTTATTSTTTAPTGTPVARNGQLQVCGTKLCNQNNQPIQMRGMSTHGIQWYGYGANGSGKCVTPASLDTLANDFKADHLRISMYIQEDGYETDPAGFTAQVDKIIDEVTKRGMYAIVDWHQLNPGDPNYNLARAKTFFTHIAQKYGNQNNILYDIANEPNSENGAVTWTMVRNYHQALIPVIRAIDANAVILLGTHGWSTLGYSDSGNSQSYMDIVNNPVSYGNVMYTFHFYAASHTASHRNVLSAASSVLPLFVTEFGTQQASGDGGNDFTNSQQWLDLLAQKQISWTNWNYSDDNRTGAVWKSNTCAGGNFSAANLKEAGVWVRDRIRNR